MGNTLFKPGAAAGLVNPMTTGGDIIYGDVDGTPLRLPNGTTGQFLRSSGTTLAPTWSTLPGAYFWRGYFPASSSNFWSVASGAGYTHMPPSGTIPSPTELNNSNFVTAVKGISNYPGIMFTAPRTGTLRLDLIASILGSNNGPSAAWATKLRETIGGTDLGFLSGKWFGVGNTAIECPMPMMALLSTTAGSTYNLEIQAVVSSGTIFIGGTADSGSELEILLNYIT